MFINKTLKELAEIVDGEVVGQGDVVIKKLSGIKEAVAGDITFLSNPKYLPLLLDTKASAVIVDKNIQCQSNTNLLKVQNPSMALTQLADKLFTKKDNRKPGVHDSAIMGENVKLGKNVIIEANVVVGDNVCIGDGCVIEAGVFIGSDSKLGNNCHLYQHVVVREDILIGNNVIIHNNTVIGSDGFGYLNIEGRQIKIPQLGNVVIESDVEIGANVTVDRARFDKTFIGQGTKIDNLVQIAHNVIIGKNCTIVAQVGISGSACIGDNVTIGGQVGMVGHIEIGSNIFIAAKSGVTKSLLKPGVYSGFPAREHMEERRIKASVSRLPDLVKRVNKLEREIEKA